MKNFEAVKYIYKDAIFSMVDDDVNQITWIGQEYPIPTKKQLSDAIKAIETEEAQAIADKEAARLSAETKLAALGLTPEEVQAIIK